MSPITAEEFTALLAQLPIPSVTPLAIAVSGGPDSMALAYMFHRWAAAQPQPPALIALIVDHALRPESGDEALMTQARLKMFGLSSLILKWEHPPITTGLHVAARKARYRLLADACRQRNICHLFTAHQREDQAETILMRLAKGSGVDGLAGMARQSESEGITLLRPLLDMPKERLIATCRAAQIDFITDASNNAPRFARGRLRQVMPLLAAEGLTIERLLDLGTRAGAAQQALDHYADRLIRNSSTMDAAGVIRFDSATLCTAPLAIIERVIGNALQSIHHQDYAPEHQSLSVLIAALMIDEDMPPRSLHGCLIAKHGGRITLQREPSSVTETLTLRAGESVIWDGKWRVTVGAGTYFDRVEPFSPPASSPPLRGSIFVDTSTASSEMDPRQGAGMTRFCLIGKRSNNDGEVFQIKALGLVPHTILDALSPNLRRLIPQGRARAALPALWRGDTLAAIPDLSPDSTSIAHAELLTRWPK